jgi:hypothetical protein
VVGTWALPAVQQRDVAALQLRLVGLALHAPQGAHRRHDAQQVHQGLGSAAGSGGHGGHDDMVRSCADCAGFVPLFVTNMLIILTTADD